MAMGFSVIAMDQYILVNLLKENVMDSVKVNIKIKIFTLDIGKQMKKMVLEYINGIKEPYTSENLKIIK